MARKGHTRPGYFALPSVLDRPLNEFRVKNVISLGGWCVCASCGALLIRSYCPLKICYLLRWLIPNSLFDLSWATLTSWCFPVWWNLQYLSWGLSLYHLPFKQWFNSGSFCKIQLYLIKIQITRINGHHHKITGFAMIPMLLGDKKQLLC